MKIVVLVGGTSEERDVSIASAAQVIPALAGMRHPRVAGIGFPDLLERICQAALT